MSGTKRRARINPRQTWHVTDEVLTVYRQMTLRPGADETWWQLHGRLADLLGTPPDVWPIVYAPNEGFSTALQRQLDEALSAQSEVEAVRYS
jgi:hypothetical protein